MPERSEAQSAIRSFPPKKSIFDAKLRFALRSAIFLSQRIVYLHLHVSIFESRKRILRSSANFKIKKKIILALRLGVLPRQKRLDELKAEKI